jgi:hypothetical protein
MVASALPDVQGSSLLEAVVAAGVLATVLTGLLPLTTTAWTVAASARRDLVAAHLARQRLHQLQILTHVTVPGAMLRDIVTRLGGAEIEAGGQGLTPTGLAPLAAPVAGSSDWLDARGGVLAWTAAAPPGAVFLRQWAVLDDGSTCLRLWVVVSGASDSGPPRASAAAVQCAWGAGAS